MWFKPLINTEFGTIAWNFLFISAKYVILGGGLQLGQAGGGLQLGQLGKSQQQQPGGGVLRIGTGEKFL